MSVGGNFNLMILESVRQSENYLAAARYYVVAARYYVEAAR
jgi:hypothetical protein